METTFWEGTCQHGVCFGRGVFEAAQSMEAVGLEGRDSGTGDSIGKGDCGIGEETANGER